MLITYNGSGDSPRSFIEPLQRTVAAGETVCVSAALARQLLATGRWQPLKSTKRKRPKPAAPKPETPNSNPENSK